MPFDQQARQALDRDFDIASHVADIPHIIAGWNERSARMRSSRSDARLELSYGEHSRMTLDFFPSGQAEDALLVFVHGGYWRALDKQMFAFVAEGFDANVAVVNYPLAPQARMGEIVSAIRALPAFLCANAAGLGFDCRRVVICGHSAGGHLAMMLALTREPAMRFAAACAIGGIYDLAPVHQAAINGEIGLLAEDVVDHSPLRLARDIGFPCLVAAGALESGEFLRQHRGFAQHWRQVGQELDTMIVPGANHFSVLDSLADRLHPLNRWLTARLG